MLAGRVEVVTLEPHCLLCLSCSMQSELVAIVVPDAEELPAWAAANNMAGKSLQELCRSELLR